MTKYKTIYSFDVFNKIEEGHKVYALDRKDRKIHTVNWMDVEDYIKLVNGENNRCEFWIEEEETEPCAAECGITTASNPVELARDTILT